MPELKGSLECAKDAIQGVIASPDMATDLRLGHMAIALYYLVQAVESLEQWQAMLLELHKPGVPMPGDEPALYG